LDIALAAAGELNLCLPLTEKVTAMFQSMADLGDSGVDHSALILELERMNNGHQGTEAE
ncbi:MAG: NAD(P)-dependent oxidoreductase, partial [Proteobacteria bacterium]|nr:NAD(P)-dependent oxidoreductase [Pseudomonadota bacterium]